MDLSFDYTLCIRTGDYVRVYRASIWLLRIDSMTPPILVWEPCDLDIFDTLEAAESYYEEWIRDHENIIFYDAGGRRLIVEPGTVRPVTINCDPEAAADPEELAAAVTEFLLAVGKSPDQVRGLSLSSLIRMAYPFARNPE